MKVSIFVYRVYVCVKILNVYFGFVFFYFYEFGNLLDNNIM